MGGGARDVGQFVGKFDENAELTEIPTEKGTVKKDIILAIASISKQHTAATLLKLWDNELTTPTQGKDLRFTEGMGTKLSKFLSDLKTKYPDCQEFFERMKG